jgi:hypothetical protein
MSSITVPITPARIGNTTTLQSSGAGPSTMRAPVNSAAAHAPTPPIKPAVNSV